jgi:hypothetical protein
MTYSPLPNYTHRQDSTLTARVHAHGVERERRGGRGSVLGRGLDLAVGLVEMDLGWREMGLGLVLMESDWRNDGGGLAVRWHWGWCVRGREIGSDKRRIGSDELGLCVTMGDWRYDGGLALRWGIGVTMAGNWQ